MNINQLKPASTFAQSFGVKCLAFGPPGSGKTPLLNTAPRPVLLAVEPGLVSMRGSNVPTFDAFNDGKRAEEFFEWVFHSNETRNFDTICVDSVSQLAEIFLTQELDRNKDGRKAYGEMSRRMMNILNGLYFAPQKHIYLIAKQIVADEMGVAKKKPYFPGQDLGVKVPHLFDGIFHIALAQIPGVAQPQKAIRTKEAFDIMARDRSGKLSDFEPHDLTALFKKAMS